jgi:hypothetical protein
MVMKISWKTGDMEKIKCNYHEIKNVESFNCLGSKIVTNGSVTNSMEQSPS